MLKTKEIRTVIILQKITTHKPADSDAIYATEPIELGELVRDADGVVYTGIGGTPVPMTIGA